MKNNKSLGQHWLKNRAILDEIADLAVAEDVETCIEIGPGLGTLTSSLLKRFERVIAIEFDENLANKLPASFPGKNLTVINADILETDLSSLTKNEKYCVAGNIPYYITSPIVRKLLSEPKKPQRIVLLVQKEVAERLAADVGDLSLIALYAQNLAEVELGPVVPAAEFTPPPKVDSEVVVLSPFESPQIPETCLNLARRGFSSPRKKLVANLADSKISKAEWAKILRDNAINPDARAEDLSLFDWETLENAQS